VVSNPRSPSDRDDARRTEGKDDMRERRQRYPIDLMEFMSSRDVGFLVSQLRAAETPTARRLASELAAARKRGGGGKVIVKGVAPERMMNALPKKPALRHLRRTLGAVAAERDSRLARRRPPQELLANNAADGRKHRVRLRSGRLWPR
jgi:hypothetical protein